MRNAAKLILLSIGIILVVSDDGLWEVSRIASEADLPAEQSTNLTPAQQPHEYRNGLPQSGDRSYARAYGKLLGTVLKSNGMPSRECLVRILRHESSHNGNLQITLEVDGQGQFQQEQLPYGTYVVVAESDTKLGLAEVELTPSSPVVDVALVPSARIDSTGRIFDLKQNPIKGAFVVVQELAPVEASHHGDLELSAVSDEAGKFSLSLPAHQPIWIVAVADGYGPSTKKIEFPGSPMTIVLHPSRSVVGRIVRAEDDFPVGGCTVHAMPIGVSILDSSTVSNDDGSFSFSNLGSYRYVLTVEHDRLAAANGPIIVSTAAEPVEIEIELVGLSRVQGIAMGLHSQRPVSNATIRAGMRLGKFIEPRFACSNEYGEFTFKGLPPGAWYLVDASSDQYMDPSLEETFIDIVPEFELNDVRVSVVESTRLVLGKVLSKAGEPVKDAAVDGLVVDLSTGNLISIPTVFTDVEGVFAIEPNSALGEIYIMAQTLDMQGEIGPLSLQDIENSQPLIVLSDSANGAVSGKVLDSTLQAIQASVFARPLERKLPFSGYSTSTRLDGTFLLHGLPPGQVELSVRRPHSPVTLASTVVSLAPHQLRHDIEFVIDQIDTTIRGKVKDIDGSPIAGARINVGDDGITTTLITSDQEGNFTLFKSVDGLDLLTVSASGFRTAVAEVSERNPFLEILLRPLPTIQIFVVDASTGAPVPRYEIAVFDARRHATHGFHANLADFQLVSNPNGEVALSIDAGATILVRASDYSTSELRLTGSLPKSLIIQLHRNGVVLVGEVKSIDGSIMGGIPVMAGGLNLREAWRGQSTIGATDIDGSFEIHGLPHIPDVVSAFDPSAGVGMAEPKEIRPSVFEAQIILSPSGAIAGRIITSTLALSDISVWVKGAQVDDVVELDDKGSFNVFPVAPGQYKVALSIPLQYASQIDITPQEVLVTSGETAEVVFNVDLME